MNLYVTETFPSKEEAIKSAPFKVCGDATLSYNKAMAKGISVEDFIDLYLKSHKGDCFIVALEKAIKDTRSKPYKVIRNNVKPGKYNKKYILCDATDKLFIDSANDMKDALSKAKNAITERVSNNVAVIKVKASSLDAIANVAYQASKNAKPGKYIIFWKDNE